MGTDALFAKIVHTAAAHYQHRNFVKKTMKLNDSQRSEALTKYIDGLSEVAFAGFKITLSLMANGERDKRRKAALVSLSQQVPQVRAAAVQDAGQGVQSAESPDRHTDEVADWVVSLVVDETDDERRMRALVDYVTGLSPVEYARFVAFLRGYKERLEDLIKNHEDSEHLSWGPYFEDQLAYLSAKARTGAKDPRWVEKLREFKRYVRITERMILACEATPPVVSGRRLV